MIHHHMKHSSHRPKSSHSKSSSEVLQLSSELSVELLRISTLNEEQNGIIADYLLYAIHSSSGYNDPPDSQSLPVMSNIYRKFAYKLSIIYTFTTLLELFASMSDSFGLMSSDLGFICKLRAGRFTNWWILVACGIDEMTKNRLGSSKL